MSHSVAQNPNGKDVVSEAYDSVEFSLNTGETDYDLDAQQSAFKTNIAYPQYVEIYTTQTISVKFNSTSNPAITLVANSNRVFDRQIAQNIYLSNSSGSSSTVRIYVK